MSALNALIENYQTNPSRSQLLVSIDKSEQLIGEALNLPQVKTQLFSDFPGAVKSLGAWGGDFIMALASDSNFDTRGYFHENGYTTVYEAKDILLNTSLY